MLNRSSHDQGKKQRHLTCYSGLMNVGGRDLSIGLITGYDGQRALDNGLRRPAEYRGCGRALKGDFFFVHQGRRLASACLERSNNGVDGARQLAGGGGTMGTVSDHEASFGAAEV